MRVYIAYALLAITYLFIALGLLLSCQPMHRFWQINPDPGRRSLRSRNCSQTETSNIRYVALCRPTNSPFYVLAVLISDVVTDLYLVSVPLFVSMFHFLLNF